MAIDLFILDGSIAIKGDDAASRTITVGQQVTNSDVFVVDTATCALSGAGALTLGAGVTCTTVTASGLATLDGGVTSPTGSSGTDNEAIGSGALGSITTGSFNTAVGSDSGNTISTASYSVCIGYNAGFDLSTGSGHTFVGAEAGENVTGGTNATAIGFRAMRTATNDNMTAIGANAMGLSNGDNNLAIGTQALLGSAITPHTGQFNVAIGQNAMQSAEGAVCWNNVAIGGNSLQNITDGAQNTCIGKDTGNDITTGDANIFIGNGTGDSTTTGSSNILIGAGLDTDAVGSDGQLKIHFAGGANTPLISGDMTDGHAGINTDIADQDSTLHVTTDSGDAISVLKLQQDDTDDEFIDFEGTSNTDLSNSITSRTTGATIQGFVRVNVNGSQYWMPYYDGPTS